MTLPRPDVTLEISDALPEAGFRLVRARVRWPSGAVSEGWGRDAVLERASEKAVGEAVERQAYMTLPAGALWGAAGEWASCLPPGQLVAYTEEQYADAAFPFSRWEPSRPGWWLRAEPALGGPGVLVLADAVCNPRAFDEAYRARLITHASSSGCASFPDAAQALWRATLELVERDAFMRHWFAQEAGVPVDMSSLPVQARERLDTLRSRGCGTGLQYMSLGMHPAWLAWAQHKGLAFTCIGTASGDDAVDTLDTALNELETQVLARLGGIAPVEILPVEVKSPADHAALYATPLHYRWADAVLHGVRPGSVSFNDVAPRFATAPAQLYSRMAAAGHPVHGVDLSLPEAAALVDGEPLFTVRAVAPGLIPLAFGHGAMPMAMDRWHHPHGARVHPFC